MPEIASSDFARWQDERKAPDQIAVFFQENEPEFSKIPP
jgi:hypothetical protein